MTHTSANRVIDGVGDGGLYASRAEHADALNAAGEVRVDFVDHGDIELRHVGVHGYQVVGESGAHNAAGGTICDRPFVQRHANSPDQAADILAPGQQRIEDTAGGKSTTDAADPHFAKIGIDADFDEHRAVGHAADGQGLE